MLRTAIIYDGVAEPCQAIVSRQLGLEMVDLTGESDIEKAAARVHQEQLHRPLSLQDDPLMRVVCMKTSENTCQMLFVLHHIIVDGWCIPIYMNDFIQSLAANIGELEQLTTTLQEHGKELHRAYNKAQQADRMKTAFLHNMTNQMIEPTEAISKDVEALCSINGKAQQDAAQLTEDIQQKGNTIADLLKNLIHVSEEDLRKEDAHD